MTSFVEKSIEPLLLFNPLNNDFVLFDQGDVKTGGSLRNAVMLSLFTESGYWQDEYSQQPLGSKFLVISRRKNTVENREDLLQEARNSLQWMIDDGICEDVSVGLDDTHLLVSIIRGNEKSTEKFNLNWSNNGN